MPQSFRDLSYYYEVEAVTEEGEPIVIDDSGEQVFIQDESIYSKLDQCDKCDLVGVETFICEICEEDYCDNCSSVFDQHSQIDYNCCSSCANRNDE